MFAAGRPGDAAEERPNSSIEDELLIEIATGLANIISNKEIESGVRVAAIMTSYAVAEYNQPRAVIIKALLEVAMDPEDETDFRVSLLHVIEDIVRGNLDQHGTQ